MAQAFTDTLITPCNAQTLATTATYTSTEQHRGSGTLAYDIWLYAQVAYASAPVGNKRVTVQIAPVHTSGGTAFTDGAPTYLGTVVAAQTYVFAWPIASIPERFKVLVKNDTDKSTASSGVTVKLEYVAVTV
jgi:hypothetical protein